MNKTDSPCFFEQFFSFYKSGLFFRRQINLSYIAGDNGLGTVTETGEKHFHLFGSCILGLIKYDEGIIQRPSTHESEGGNLNYAFLNEGRGPLKIYHIIEGVIKGTQIGINLFGKITGQKAELLARFHGRSGEDDAVYLFLQKGSHGHSHGQISLTGSCRTDSKHHIVFSYSIYVKFLGDALRCDDPFF